MQKVNSDTVHVERLLAYARAFYFEPAPPLKGLQVCSISRPRVRAMCNNARKPKERYNDS